MHTYETANEAKAQVVEHCLAARANGTDVTMLASRNVDIADLNELAHRHLVEVGIVHGPVRIVDVDDRRREFQAGNEVLFLRNDRRLGVRNGMRATTERVHPMGSVDLTVTTSDRQRIDVPRWYIDQGHLAHGYAMTIHKAQGLTCNTALVYATDDLYRELGYVALSRGRDLNVIYTTGDVKIDHEAHIRSPQRVPSEMLMAGLSTSRAQEVASPALLPGPYAHEVEYTERNLRMAEQRIQELEDRKRPLRERLKGADPELDREVSLRDRLHGDMTDLRSRQRASDERFAARKRYLADHDGDRQKIEQVDELLGSRAQSAVADAMIETPEYLKELIGDYRSATHKGRWIDAATKVEDYRHQHVITDVGSAFGVEPLGSERFAWQHAHDEVAETLEPPTRSHGLRMR